MQKRHQFHILREPTIQGLRNPNQSNFDRPQPRNPSPPQPEPLHPSLAKDKPMKTERQRKRDHAMLVEFQTKEQRESNRKVKIACNFSPIPQSLFGLEGQITMETDEPTHENLQALISASMKQPGPNSPITLEVTPRSVVWQGSMTRARVTATHRHPVLAHFLGKNHQNTGVLPLWRSCPPLSYSWRGTCELSTAERSHRPLFSSSILHSRSRKHRFFFIFS